MSTYSSSLRIELITTGDQAGTWGNTTNTNLGTLIESGICGYTSVAVSSANQALTALNGAADESRNMVLALTTSTGAAFAVYAPPAEKVYVVYNASSYTATIYNSTVIGNTTAAGTGVAIPAGKTMTVWSDGTNFAAQNNHLASLTLGTPLAIADGGTGATTASGARTNLGLGTMATQNSNAVSITGGSISGITDLAVADGGTGASTAADARTNLGLGTMATQNASSVSITGGSISGITDLAVADGGTGASTAADARTNLGLGTMATQNASSVSITGGSITGITDLAVADGGTGSSTAAGARTNLGLGTMATQAANSVAITGGTLDSVSFSNGQVASSNIFLRNQVSPTVTGSGQMEWSTAGKTIAVGDGTSTVFMANLSTAQMLSNKTLSSGSTWQGNTIPVAYGGTGVPMFSTGSILRGNGTSPISAASAADIVTAIGATAVQNATSASNATTVTNGVYTTNFTGSNQSLAENGYQKLPGGLVMAWCKGSIVGSETTTTVNFPYTFTTVYNIQVSTYGTPDAMFQLVSFTTSSAVFYLDYFAANPGGAYPFVFIIGV